MIPAEWEPRARAPKGKILVKRDPREKYYHDLIHIAPSYLNHIRTATGTVIDVHPSLFGQIEFEVGDRVALAPTAGKKLLFGYYANEESELWVYSPISIKAVLYDAEYAETGESFLRNEKREVARQPTVDEKFTEGDRAGIR